MEKVLGRYLKGLEDWIRSPGAKDITISPVIRLVKSEIERSALRVIGAVFSVRKIDNFDLTSQGRFII